MKEEVQITMERIDDFVVLLALMQQMDLPGNLDRHIAHLQEQGQYLPDPSGKGLYYKMNSNNAWRQGVLTTWVPHL
jgi:hypothetical protein